MSIAFVLSGGGSLGAVQVGMVRALYQRGLRPDAWVGTSVGAVNAAFLAARPPTRDATDELAALWASIRRRDIFPLRPITGFVGFFGARNHLVSSDPLRRLLERSLGLARLEDALMPLHVVATELHDGEELLLSRGPAVDAVLASLSIPGILPPVPWGDGLLIDGGVSNNTPISHAVELGASEVYVLPAGAACELDETPRSALGILLQALSVMLMRHLLAEIERLRSRAKLVVIPPPCPLHVAPTDFTHSLALIATGELVAQRHLAAVDAGESEPAPLFDGGHHDPGQSPALTT